MALGVLRSSASASSTAGAGADGLTPATSPRHLRSVAVASSALAAVQSIGLA
jgi:hypothetical protein